MAGIYNRDNIQYGTLLDAMLNRRERELRNEQERQRRMAEHVVNGLKMFGRTAAMAYGGSGASQELADLEAQKAALIDEERNKAVESMADYNPQIPSDYGARAYAPTYGRVARENENPYALPGDPYANASEYVKYRMAMNKLFGGMQ